MRKWLKSPMSAMISMLILSSLLLVSSAFAWLSMNRNVDSDGMDIEIDSLSKLVISKTTTFNGEKSITLDRINRELMPAMHGGSGESNLQKVLDTVVIDKDTGLGNNISYEVVPISNSSRYYVDYVFYISSERKALSNALLSARITAPDGIPSNYHKSASIDFYVDGVYKDTLNLAGLSLSNDTSYNASATKNEAFVLSGARIPCIDDTTKKYLTITLRCYFDGALHDSATTTYVRTNRLDTSDLNLKITFSALGDDVDPS